VQDEQLHDMNENRFHSFVRTQDNPLMDNREREL